MITDWKNISFIENGKLQYNIIVYPDNLDAVPFNADGTFNKRDRYKVELRCELTAGASPRPTCTNPVRA